MGKKMDVDQINNKSVPVNAANRTGLAPEMAAPACLNLDYSSLEVLPIKTRRNTNSMRREKILKMITLSTFKKGLISKTTLRRLVPSPHSV